MSNSKDSAVSGQHPSENTTAPLVHDIYTDPAIALAKSSDPFVAFFRENGRALIIAIVAALAIFYIVQTFRHSKEARLGKDGGTFMQLRSDFVALRAKEKELGRTSAQLNELTTKKTLTEVETKRKDNLQNQLAEGQKALEAAKSKFEGLLPVLGDTEAPYKFTKTLYQGLYAASQGKAEGVSAAYGGKTWEQVTETDSAERLILELQALHGARVQLDSDGKVELGKAALIALAERGQYVHVQAALVLAAVATSQPDRDTALATLESISSRHPEQMDLLRSAIKQLGGKS